MRCNTLSVDQPRYYSFMHMWDMHSKETLPKTLTLADEETRSSICSHYFARVALSRITVTLLLAHGQKPFRRDARKEKERERGRRENAIHVKMCIEIFVATFFFFFFFLHHLVSRKERERKGRKEINFLFCTSLSYLLTKYTLE